MPKNEPMNDECLPSLIKTEYLSRYSKYAFVTLEDGLILGEPLLDFLSFFGRLGTQDYMVTLGNYGKEKGTTFFRQWFVGNFHSIT